MFDEENRDTDTEESKPTPTHIIRYWESQDVEMLFRADDQIAIGQCKERTLIFGPEPNKRRSHVFMTPDGAKAFLRKQIAEQDLKDRGIEGPVVIDAQNGEPLIQLAEGVDFMDLPQHGSHRSIGGKFQPN